MNQFTDVTDVASMSKPLALICDIDGTIADCDHRRMELPDWKAFFTLMGEDKPVFPTIELIRTFLYRSFREGSPVVLFVSGRPEDYRSLTEHWLNLYVDPCAILPNNDRSGNNLFMRPKGDHRPDHVVKKEILEKIREYFDPFLAIDDRSTVVSMWRSNGVFCLQAPDKTLSLKPGDTTPFVPVQGECLLTLMVGPSGGGKSTYAQKHFHPASILESDQFRAELTGDFKNQSANAAVFAAVHDVATSRLRNGLPVVIDATNLHRKDRMAGVGLAPHGSVVRYAVVDRPLQTKLDEPDWRPEALIRKHDMSFKSQLKDILAGDFLSNVVVVNEVDYAQ